MQVIERMTFGDANETAKILHRFAKDSFSDIDELCSMINEKQVDNILLITHRIAGRTAQAGATELSKGFRMAEIALHKDEVLNQKWTRNILELADELHHLSVVAEQYNKEIIS
jgi:HPt (histidine-containing phosphotransfer) domain-containing protein